MKALFSLGNALVLLLLSAVAITAQPAPRIVGLSTPEAASDQHFGTILNIRELPDGRLLVNDGQRRQLSILDARLKNRVVAIDSVVTGSQGYGRSPATLIPYVSDSTLFTDRESRTFLVLGPTGDIARVMAPAKTSDIAWLNLHLGGVDGHGNLIYQGGQLLRGNGAGAADARSFDSLPIVRANAETRAIDTLAVFAVATGMRTTIAKEGAKEVTTLTSSPISYVDDWAVLSDGTVLIIRGHDYHAELLGPRGDLHVSAKLPFDWKRVSDEDKQKLVDSAKVVIAQRAAKQSPRGTTYPPGVALPGGVFVVKGCSSVECDGTIRHFLVEEVAPLAEIPDYWPPIRRNAATPDLDNHAWVLPTTSAQSLNGELVYDVIDSAGALSKRVRIPAGRSIAGFGRKGVVYLMHRDDDGWAIEKTRIIDPKQE